MSSTEKGYVHKVGFKQVPVEKDGQSQTIDVMEIWLIVDRSKKIKDSEEYDTKKSFGMSVEMWGPKVQYLKNKINQGSIVLVTGRYEGNNYEDKNTGQTKYSQKLVATDVALLPYNLESVVYKQKQNSTNQASILEPDETIVMAENAFQVAE